MKFILLSAVLVTLGLSTASTATPHALKGTHLWRREGEHKFTLINKCPQAVTPKIIDTKCGFSPRCADAAAFSGQQPGPLAPGATIVVSIDKNWVGRIINAIAQCGEKGDNCSLTEFNMDAQSAFTPQTYDISHIQGFTQSFEISAEGCETVTCKVADCGCRNGYKPGDLTGCGSDQPVRACGPGPKSFTVVYCP